MTKVRVSEAEIIAAKLTIEINDRLGRKTPAQIVRLANAGKKAPRDAEVDRHSAAS